jgi:hypothetical protein
MFLTMDGTVSIRALMKPIVTNILIYRKIIAAMGAVVHANSWLIRNQASAVPAVFGAPSPRNWPSAGHTVVENTGQSATFIQAAFSRAVVD